MSKVHYVESEDRYCPACGIMFALGLVGSMYILAGLAYYLLP